MASLEIVKVVPDLPIEDRAEPTLPSLASPLVTGLAGWSALAAFKPCWIDLRVSCADGSQAVVFELECPVDRLDGLGLTAELLSPRRRRRYKRQSEPVVLRLQLFSDTTPEPLAVAEARIEPGGQRFVTFAFPVLAESAGRRFTCVVHPMAQTCRLRILGRREPGQVVIAGNRRRTGTQVHAMPYGPVAPSYPACAEDWPLVSVIILTHNSSRFIRTCLDSILQQTYPRLEIVVIDNASQDDTIRVIESEYPEVRLFPQSVGLEFCRGNNEGLRQSRGEFVHILNADTKLLPEAIERMMRVMLLSQHIAAVGSSISTKGSLLRYADPLLRHGRITGDLSAMQRPSFVLAGCGCSVIVRKSWIDRVGFLFDPDYVTNQEDHDFGIRCWLAGGATVHLPETLVLHIGGGVYGLVNPERDRPIYRNMLLTFYRNAEFGNLLRTLVQALAHCRNRYRLLGIADFLGTAASFRDKRRATQRDRVISDAGLAWIASGRIDWRRRDPVDIVEAGMEASAPSRTVQKYNNLRTGSRKRGDRKLRAARTHKSM
jgi:GT2 family glycosyltransferase